MTTLARPRALLFDWDNTLVDTWETIHAALVVTFAALGLEPWSLAETKRRVARSLRDAFPPLFGARWEEACRLYLDTFQSMHLERLRAIDGAGALLAELAGTELYLGVVSNKTGPMLRREADYLGWTPLFRRLVGAGDAPRDKPDAAPIALALAGSGISGRETWYVGDTALDMECAANAGCLGVLLGEREEENVARARPTLRFADCGALGRHLRGLCSPGAANLL